jgi:hypothetical protein
MNKKLISQFSSEIVAVVNTFETSKVSPDPVRELALKLEVALAEDESFEEGYNWYTLRQTAVRNNLADLRLSVRSKLLADFQDKLALADSFLNAIVVT